MEQCDAIVIGSGVAGLSFAIKLAEQRPDLKVALFTKEEIIDSNSNYAQGGIASTFDFSRDSFESHILDTLKSGGGLSNPKIVDFVVRSGPERIEELALYGAKFNKNKNSVYDLVLEGGHSSPRVVHSLDNTGSEIVRTLVAKIKTLSNIEIKEFCFCFELLKTNEDKICGTRIFNTKTNTIEEYWSRVVVLSTGGSGQVFKYTTNPSVATGDGLGLGMAAGAKISNLHYFQFHPTAFVEQNKSQLFLISEAVRGFGAYIVNNHGDRFLFNTDSRGELATRDVVSKAIFNELRLSKSEYVYMDCRHLDKKLFEEKFPMIFKYLKDRGIDISSQLFPIAPAAHYQCGGLKVDQSAKTSIKGLFAIGEVAETGLHGANRLASNSLLEALVFAHEAAKYLIENIQDYPLEKVSVVNKIGFNEKYDAFYNQKVKEVKTTMSNYVTIASSFKNVESAKSKLSLIEKAIQLRENSITISLQKLILKNTLLVAQQMVNSRIEHYPTHENSKLPQVTGIENNTY